MGVWTDKELEKGIAHLEHGFMTPQVWEEMTSEYMDGLGDAITCPSSEYPEDSTPVAGTFKLAWWAKLSASGYMDQTDTSGPFDSEREAAEYLCETYADDLDDCDECHE